MANFKIGKVLRPDNGVEEGGFATTTLTATVTKGTVTKSKTFVVKVREQGISDDQAVAFDKATITIPNFNNIMATFVTLASEGESGTVVTWKSGTPAVISDAGLVTRPANGESEVQVVMTATITKGSSTDTKVFDCVVKAWTDAEEVAIAKTALTWGAIRGANVDQANILYSLNLPTSFERGTTVVWTSTNEEVINPLTGVVARPDYSQGDVSVILTGTITKGTVTEYVQFPQLKVIKKTQTNLEAVTAALGSLTASTILGSNSSLTAVTSDLVLPKSSNNPDAQSVSFAWSQVKLGGTTPSTFVVLDMNTDPGIAIITRPESTATSGENVTLTVTATSSTAAGDVSTKTQVFNITILKKEASA